MQKPQIPANEAERLAALHDYEVMHTAPEKAFDDLTQLAAYICGTPMSFVSLVDADEQWFKSKVGLDIDGSSRDTAFCAHSIAQPNEVMVVSDAENDKRFEDNPLVIGKPHIRFYASAPLITPEGHAIGTLCTADHQPRELSEEQLEALRALSRQAVAQLELRRSLQQLKQEQAKTERLLCNVLPMEIALRLKDKPNAMAKRMDNVSILFADLVGFTRIASVIPPETLLQVLNDIFSLFDDLTEKHGLEKIKTIGDAYMAVAGAPQPHARHAQAAADMALDMQAELARFNQECQYDFQLRIGIHSGTVVAGVIGTKKFSYDLWGDTVNIASRMESHGKPGCIQISQATLSLLGEAYRYEACGLIPIKGRGTMATYFLLDHLKVSVF